MRNQIWNLFAGGVGRFPPCLYSWQINEESHQIALFGHKQGLVFRLFAVATTNTGDFLSDIQVGMVPPILEDTPLSREPSPPEPASNFSISSIQRQKAIASAIARALEILPSVSPTTYRIYWMLLERVTAIPNPQQLP